MKAVLALMLLCCPDVRAPADQRGTANTLLSPWESGGPQGVNGTSSCDRHQNLSPGVCLHRGHKAGIHGRKTNSSPIFHLHVFHFLALEWNISQDKIWIKSTLLVSNISLFYKIYGHFLLDWEKCWWNIRLCLHFSLILAASLGSWSLSWWAFTIWLFSWSTTAPTPPHLSLCPFLCHQLPVFCQEGYLCNCLPFVFWLLQRLSLNSCAHWGSTFVIFICPLR